MSKPYRELQQQVIRWAADKGILIGATPQTQAAKMLEEANELHEAVENLKKFAPSMSEADCYRFRQHILEEMGDVQVTIIILAQLLAMDPLDGLYRAHEKISKRNGKMVGGVFVKDEDL